MPREEPAVDPQKQDELAKEEARAQEIEVRDFQKIIAMPEGRRVIRRILDSLHGGVIPTDIRAYNDDGSFNTEETIGNLGAWGVGQVLQLAILDYAPDMYIKMTVEGIRAKARELEQIRRAKRKKEQDDAID